MLKVFTVMPFSDAFANIWKHGIEAACIQLGYKCDRADLINKPGFILSHIYDSIAEADVIIGEMSGNQPNANVFYEIGFAHALGKETLLLAASENDLKAFDTRSRRHFLHANDAEKARLYLMHVLPEVKKRLALEPKPPHGTVIYEWPSPTFRPPELFWLSSKDERYSQIDGDGGQRILETDGFGQSLCISNTAELWNHSSGRSIMTLLFTRDLLPGDILHLYLEARASERVDLAWVGDGGWVEVAGKKSWAQVWRDRPLTISKGAVWARYAAEAIVAPTCEGYDLKRGTTIYLMTRSGQHTLLLKQIRLVHRPAPKAA